MKSGLKDVLLMLATAEENGLNWRPKTSSSASYEGVFEAGMEDADWSAFYEMTRREAGCPDGTSAHCRLLGHHGICGAHGR